VLTEEEEGVTRGPRDLTGRRGRRAASLVARQQVDARGSRAGVQPQAQVTIAGDLEDERVRGRGFRPGEVAADQQRPDLVDQVVEGDRV
jgi:hypothetical protein